MVILTKFWFFLILTMLEVPFKPTKPHSGILRSSTIDHPRRKTEKRIAFLPRGPFLLALRGHFLLKWRLIKKISFAHLKACLLSFPKWYDTYTFIWKGDPQQQFENWPMHEKFIFIIKKGFSRPLEATKQINDIKNQWEVVK